MAEAQGIIPTARVSRVPEIGGLDTVMDGGACVFNANEWAWVEWTLPEPLHLTAALASWKGWQAGDYGYAAIALPSAAWVLTAQADKDQDEVPMTGAPAQLLAAYDPAAMTAAKGYPVRVWLELWDGSGSPFVRSANPGLRERAEVDSVDYDNSNLVLKSNLVDDHPASTTMLVPCVGAFTEPRGTKNLEGGIFLCGEGFTYLGSPDRSEATEQIDAGACVCLRVKATSAAGERCLSSTFQMRRPSS